MRKTPLIGLALLVVFVSLPLLATLMVTTSTQATTDCRIHHSGDPGDLWAGTAGPASVDGPTGGPVHGTIGIAQANIPTRSGPDGFRASMPRVLSTSPDFVTLNEMSGRSLAQIQAAAPGYRAFRETAARRGPGSSQSMDTVVLWKNDRWIRGDAGRIQLVNDDQTYYRGRPVTWDRFATWALLQRRSDHAVVSIVSVHHMTNPQKFPRQHGHPPATRKQQYGRGMDLLLQLVDTLGEHGPVLIGGDLNTHESDTHFEWSAAAKMNAAGYGWHHRGVDFIFFPQYAGVRLASGSSGPMVSDHPWIAARLDMNGASPSGTDPTTTNIGGAAAVVDEADGAALATRDELAELLDMRFDGDYPTLTVEQARNATIIALVADDEDVPRFGLQIAIATAIQESRLVNLAGGDRDSGGLFQQRPSAGWGTPSQVTNPRLATLAFFGQARHTSNPGLLDIPGWQRLRLTEAAQRVQGSGFPDAYAQWATVAGQIADVLTHGPDDSLTGIGRGCRAPVAAGEVGASCRSTQSPAEQGLTPDALEVLRSVDAQFGPHTYLGVGERSTNPGSDHPFGRAVDVMIDRWQSTAGILDGSRIAHWARGHAGELGVTYVIWRARIWSPGDHRWRPYTHPSGVANPTLLHMDHVHVSVNGSAGTADCGHEEDPGD